MIDQVRRSRATWTVLVAGVALQVVFVLLHAINKELLGDGTFLALDRDYNLPSWTTTAAFVVAGSIYGLLAWLRADRRLQLGLLATIVISFGSSELNSSLDLPYVLVVVFQTLEEVTEMLTATLIVAAGLQPLIDAISECVRAPEPPVAPS